MYNKNVCVDQLLECIDVETLIITFRHHFDSSLNLKTLKQANLSLIRTFNDLRMMKFCSRIDAAWPILNTDIW
jgi:hypothetical protein